MEVVYTTHATSTDNVAGIASGHSDPDLARLGVEQCAERAALWAAREFDVVVASDLVRSRRTAELAFAGRAVAIRIDARLRECNYGELNGAAKASVDAIRASCVGAPFPGGGESYEAVVVRMRVLLDDLVGEFGGGAVLLIGHHAPYVALEHLVGGADGCGVPLAEALASTANGGYWQPEWTYQYGGGDDE